MNMARSFNNWRKYRQTVNELDRMTARELRDLGPSRHPTRHPVRDIPAPDMGVRRDYGLCVVVPSTILRSFLQATLIEQVG